MHIKRLAWGIIPASLILFLGVIAIQPVHADGCNATSIADPTCANNSGVYGLEMRAINVDIAANPNAELTPIPIDVKQLYEHAFRKVLKATDIYNAPGGGQVVGHIDDGFNFVNAGKVQNKFVEIRPDQWLPESVLGPVDSSVSKFSGVLLPNGMPDQAFGWMVLDTKPSRVPGEKPAVGTPTIPHYTLINYYATENVNGWDWYMIGPDQWVIQTRVARLEPVKRPDGVSGKWFAVDLYEQTLIAYQDDTPIFATLIASGLPKFPTDEGLFKIISRYEVVKMTGAAGQPDFYYLPQVPWVMYFNQDEQALHGAYWHDAFGYRHSHGCINMSMTDAQWVFDWTKDSPSAFVYIYHSGEYKQ